MGKERFLYNKRQKIFFSIFVVILLVISTFIVVAYTQIDSISKEISNKGTDMSVKIFTDKTSGHPPFTVNFSSILVNNNGKISYLWDFGDGESSQEKKPVHIYDINDSCNCRLTVTNDKGISTTDSIEISCLHNLAPRASIEISSTSPERKFQFRPSYLILRKTTKTYGGRNLYYLRNFGIAPLSEEESTIYASALVSDPEGDEIISYEWELKPPTITLFGLRPIHPAYKYSGKNVTFNLLDTYATGKYDLKLTVIDEAGNRDTETISFVVEEHPTESSTFGMAKYAKDSWMNQLSDIPAIKGIVATGIGYLFYKTIVSEKTSFPLLKVIFMIILSSLKLQPEEYGNETMMDVYGQFFDKYESLKPVAKNLFDKIQEVLIKNDRIGEAEQLQITEEQLGLDNKRPTISNPFPKLDDENIPRNCPYVSIKVNDAEGDKFNVTISGDYINTITFSDVTNNTFNATFNYPTPEGLPSREEINWNVTVIDQNEKITQEEYKFKTFA